LLDSLLQEFQTPDKDDLTQEQNISKLFYLPRSESCETLSRCFL